MRWAVSDSESAEIRRKRLEKHGKEIPNDLYPPVVMDDGALWFEAFWELSNDRQILEFQGGYGPIPAASIARHCAGWNEEDAALFRRCIRAMDAEFMRRDEPDIPESDNPARDAFRMAMGS